VIEEDPLIQIETQTQFLLFTFKGVAYQYESRRVIPPLGPQKGQGFTTSSRSIVLISAIYSPEVFGKQ
jgi:hypothetical protein